MAETAEELVNRGAVGFDHGKEPTEALRWELVSGT